MYCFHHDDVIKWKHFPRYWPFVRGIPRSPMNSPHKGQWRGALMFSLICARMNGWVNNREAGDLRRHPTHCDAIVMFCRISFRLENGSYRPDLGWCVVWLNSDSNPKLNMNKEESDLSLSQHPTPGLRREVGLCEFGIIFACLQQMLTDCFTRVKRCCSSLTWVRKWAVWPDRVLE